MSQEEFEYLDRESEELLNKILQMDNVVNENLRGLAIEHLVLNGYLTGVDGRSLSDIEPVYILTGITSNSRVL